MGKKKRHEEHVNHERWLISYADFITLLFAFFVVLFSSAPKEDTNTRMITAATQNSFSTFAIFKGGGSKISGNRMKQRGDGVELQSEDEEALSTEPEHPKGKVAMQKNMSISQESYKPNNRVRDSLLQDFYKKIVDNNGNYDVSMESRGLVVSFNDVAFFSTGSDEPDTEVLKGLKEIISLVGDRQNFIQVEGHSDGTKWDKGYYSSNMEISTKRAQAISKLLVKNLGIPGEYISTVGYGGFRPKGDKTTDAGRSKNRRVDIVLLKSIPEAKNLAMPHFEEEDEAIGEAVLAIDGLIE